MTTENDEIEKPSYHESIVKTIEGIKEMIDAEVNYAVEKERGEIWRQWKPIIGKYQNDIIEYPECLKDNKRWICPRCNLDALERYFNYCPVCGIFFDWIG